MLRDMGLTDEELEEARRQALEGMAGELSQVVPVPTPGAEPGTTSRRFPEPSGTTGNRASVSDLELEAARGQDRGALLGHNLAQSGYDFTAKYLSGGQPLKAFAPGASAEGQLMADRSAKAAKAKAEEARMQAAALAEFKRRGLALTEQQAKGAEADRAADNARADSKLGLERERFAWEKDPSNPKNQPKPRGSGAEKIRGSNLEGMPYGYELEPGAHPSKGQREEAAKILQQRDDVLPAVQQLRKLVSAGPQRLVSPTAIAEVKQLAQEIATAIRVMENLGVPSGPDTKITLELIGDPNSKLNEMAGVMPKLLDNLDAYFNRKVDTKMRIHGIKKSSGERPTPAAAGRDDAALEWAKENPEDPRAAKILELNGGT